MNTKMIVFCFLALVFSFVDCQDIQAPQAPLVYYAATYSAYLRPGGEYVPITGLALTLPPLSATIAGNSALVTLAVTAPYANGTNFPGIQFTIGFADSPSTKIPNDQAWGSFTYANKNPYAEGLSQYRAPVTLQVLIPLTKQPQKIVGVWTNVRGSEGHIDSLASLSAIITWNFP